MQPVNRSKRNVSNLVITCSIVAVGYLLWDKNKYLTYTQGLEVKVKDLNDKLDLALLNCEPMYMTQYTDNLNIVNPPNLELKIQELQQQLASVVTNCESCIQSIDLSKDHLAEKQALKLQIKELNRQLELAVVDYSARIKGIDAALVGYDKQFDDVLLSAYQVISAIEQRLEDFKRSLNSLDPSDRKTSLDALSAHMKKLEILDQPSLTPAFSVHQAKVAPIPSDKQSQAKTDQPNTNNEEPQKEYTDSPKLVI